MHGSYVESCTAHIQAQSRHTHKHGQTAETWLQNLHGFWIACDAAIKPLFCYTHTNICTCIHSHSYIRLYASRAAEWMLLLLLFSFLTPKQLAFGFWARLYTYTQRISLSIFWLPFFKYSTQRTYIVQQTHTYTFAKIIFTVCSQSSGSSEISFHFISKKSPVKESDSIERDSGEHIA